MTHSSVFYRLVPDVNNLFQFSSPGCQRTLSCFRSSQSDGAHKILNKDPILRHIATFPYRVVRGSQIVLNYVQPNPLGSVD